MCAVNSKRLVCMSRICHESCKCAKAYLVMSHIQLRYVTYEYGCRYAIHENTCGVVYMQPAMQLPGM